MSDKILVSDLKELKRSFYILRKLNVNIEVSFAQGDVKKIETALENCLDELKAICLDENHTA